MRHPSPLPHCAPALEGSVFTVRGWVRMWSRDLCPARKSQASGPAQSFPAATDMDRACHLTFSGSTIKKKKKKELKETRKISCGNIFSLIQYIQDIPRHNKISYCFCAKSSKSHAFYTYSSIVSIRLAVFQGLRSYMWLSASGLESAALGQKVTQTFAWSSFSCSLGLVTIPR